MSDANANEWTSERIRELRKKRGQTQREFGLELWDTTPNSAQNQVSRLERSDRSPGGAVRRTLQRMEEGQI